MAEGRRLFRVGTASIASPRGLLALVFYIASMVGAFLLPLLHLLGGVTEGGSAEEPPLTQEVLLLNLAFNTIVLLLFPLAALALTYPNLPAVGRRLGLILGPRLPFDVLLGSAACVASLLALAGILAVLQQADVYTAEESPLVPQIQALLTWPLVVLVSVIAAVTEEVFFRGVLQPRIGLLASSLLFGFVHLGYGTLLQVAAPIALGLLFGVLYQGTRRLWAPLTAHFLFDFIELTVLLLEK